MDLGLKNKNVLVTASSMGIGRAAVDEFIKEGCNVALCSSSKENILIAVEEIKKLYNVDPFWTVCDINKPNDIEKTVNLVQEKIGQIDILVNNCGGPTPGYFENLNDADWQYAFDQVLMSAVRFTRLVLPGMKSKHWGRIINVTSISVKQPIDNLILSNSLRSAVTAMTKTLSNEFGKFNITFNNVAPGYTLTARLYELAVSRAKESGESHEHVLGQMANNVPMKRLARPDELGAFIVYLASEQAAYITGTTTQIDGGIIKSLY